jgi:hypothetical protein
LGGKRERLQYIDVLLTLAEVSVAMVGFSSLLVVFGTREVADRSPAAGARVRGIFEAGVFVLPFCILPVFMTAVSQTEATGWRLSSGLFAMAYSPLFVSQFRRFTRLSRETDYSFGWIPRTATAGGTLSILMAVACAAGAFGEHAALAYLGVIIWPLVGLTVNFFGILAELLPAP